MRKFISVLAACLGLMLMPGEAFAAGLDWGLDSPPATKAATPIPPCNCGCMVTGQCKCKNCAERTADPTFKPATAAVPVTQTTMQLVCDGRTCRWVQVQTPAVAAANPTTTIVRRGWGQDDDPFRCNTATPATTTVCGPNGCQTVTTASFQSNATSSTQTVTSQGSPQATGPIRRLLGRVFHPFGGRFACCGG